MSQISAFMFKQTLKYTTSAIKDFNPKNQVEKSVPGSWVPGINT